MNDHVFSRKISKKNCNQQLTAASETEVCILIYKFRQINSQVAGGPSMSMDGHNMPGNLPVPNNKNEGALVMLQTNQLKVCKLIILK